MLVGCWGCRHNRVDILGLLAFTDFAAVIRTSRQLYYAINSAEPAELSNRHKSVRQIRIHWCRRWLFLPSAFPASTASILCWSTIRVVVFVGIFYIFVGMFRSLRVCGNTALFLKGEKRNRARCDRCTPFQKRPPGLRACFESEQRLPSRLFCCRCFRNLA